LKKIGVNDENIFFVGNAMIDTLVANLGNFKPPAFFANRNDADYFILTLHRPTNVDDIEILEALLDAIGSASRGIDIFFPIHPRTKKSIQAIKALPKNIFVVDPLPYLEFNYLVQNSKAVITDSGGITEEATYMGVPCLTLRDSTERPETINDGTNVLVGTNPLNIKPMLDELFDNKWKKGKIPLLWDGKTSERIVEVIENLI